GDAGKRYLVGEEFVYLRGRTSRVAKVTLPSPSMFVNFWSPERSQSAYASLEHFLADVGIIGVKHALVVRRDGESKNPTGSSGTERPQRFEAPAARRGVQMFQLLPGTI